MLATTPSIVFAGEHRVTDLFPDGTSNKRIKRTGTAGEHVR